MASVVLTNAVYYREGISGVSDVVGYESYKNRVVRYNLLPPPTGANRIDLTFTGISQGNGTPPEMLRFYVGTDPSDHANAGATSAYTGTLTRTTTSGLYTFSGGADIVLMPNTVYYVWVFPATTTYGWLAWPGNTGIAELTGGAISTLTISSGTLAEEQTITVSSYNKEFSHSITFEIGAEKGTICEKTKETIIKWVPSIELARQITNAPSGNAAMTITTYNGQTVIGSQVVQMELKVPEYVVPTVTATWTDTSGADNIMGTLVKLVSKLAVDVIGTGAYGSTVTGASMTLNGKIYAGGQIQDNGDLELVVKVSDSRGRQGETAYTIYVADYAVPSVAVNASRCLEDGTPDDIGEFANVTVTGFVMPVNNVNTASIYLTYGWEEETISVEPGEINYSKIISAPSVSTLEIAASISDKLLASQSASMILSIGYATVDYYAGGKGIAFGTTAKQEGFTCAMDAFFTGAVVGVLPAVESADHPGCYYRTVADRKEWYNPPFVVGTEYCTTQRWKGKPVFAKLLQFTGLFPNGAQTHYFSNQFPGVTEVVSLTATGTNGSTVVSLPFVDQANSFSCWAYNVSGGQIAIASNYKTAYTSVSALVKYIK